MDADYLAECLTLSQIVEKYPGFSAGRLRNYRHNKASGFDKCSLIIGGIIYIHEPSFLEWVEAKRKEGKAK